AEKWYGWEQRYEIQLEVADLPAGLDPADVWRKDPAALQRAVERATPFLQFRLDRVLAAADLATLEGRARAAETGAPIVAQNPSSSSTGSTTACSSIPSRVARSKRSHRATASTRRSRRSTVRCAIFSNASRSRSQSHPTNRRRCART